MHGKHTPSHTRAKSSRYQPATDRSPFLCTSQCGATLTWVIVQQVFYCLTERWEAALWAFYQLLCAFNYWLLNVSYVSGFWWKYVVLYMLTSVEFSLNIDKWKNKSASDDVWPRVVFPGYPNQAPYPMAQPGGSVAPYPSAPGGYGDPSQAPPPGFNMGYNQGPPPVMYQPGPMGPGPVPGPEYGGHPGGISPAPAMAPAAVAVGVPPGLEYLTQVGQRQLALFLDRPKTLT